LRLADELAPWKVGYEVLVALCAGRDSGDGGLCVSCVLGINAYHGDSSACIVRDGRLIAAAEGERFRRVKHWARVRFRGQIGADQKAVAFSEADVCVVPSYRENFGNVVAESLAHAVPVIVSKGAPWPGIVERRCGLWVDNDPQSLASAIRQIATMDLGAMGERGRAWVTSDYSWDEVAGEMLAVYRYLSANSPKGHSSS
jgi:glycosyltransferase involved in cell wall biosynthesis